MRVAVRRLRSAVKVFGRALRCPTIDAADTLPAALRSTVQREQEAGEKSGAASQLYYLPTTLVALSALRDNGFVAPATAHAVTPELREWYADGDAEELEYAAGDEGGDVAGLVGDESAVFLEAGGNGARDGLRGLDGHGLGSGGTGGSGLVSRGGAAGEKDRGEEECEDDESVHYCSL